jgi:hypothetical protein
MRARTGITAVLVASMVAVGCGGDDETTADDTPADQDEATQQRPDQQDDAVAAVPEGVTSDAWTALAPAPTALTEVGAAAFEGELWVVGGISDEPTTVTDVQVFDPATDSWRSGPDIPEPLHHTAVVATGDQLVVIGGYVDLGFTPTAEVFVLDDDRQGWSSGPALPSPRGAGAAAWDGTRIVYGGGITDDGLTDEVLAIDDLDDGTWQPTGNLSIPRDHLGASSDGEGRVWFLAGRENSLDANLATVDLVEGDGVETIGELPTARGGVAAFHAPAHGACLAGGEQPDATFAEVECIDAEGATTTLPELAEARHGLGADVIDGVAYVALGGPEPMLAVSDTVEALRLG